MSDPSSTTTPGQGSEQPNSVVGCKCYNKLLDKIKKCALLTKKLTETELKSVEGKDKIILKSIWLYVDLLKWSLVSISSIGIFFMFDHSDINFAKNYFSIFLIALTLPVSVAVFSIIRISEMDLLLNAILKSSTPKVSLINRLIIYVTIAVPVLLFFCAIRYGVWHPSSSISTSTASKK
ncbi:hypothetical protein ACOSOMT5_P2205 [Acidiphilium sp. MT5]